MYSTSSFWSPLTSHNLSTNPHSHHDQTGQTARTTSPGATRAFCSRDLPSGERVSEKELDFRGWLQLLWGKVKQAFEEYKSSVFQDVERYIWQFASLNYWQPKRQALWSWWRQQQRSCRTRKIFLSEQPDSVWFLFREWDRRLNPPALFQCNHHHRTSSETKETERRRGRNISLASGLFLNISSELSSKVI